MSKRKLRTGLRWLAIGLTCLALTAACGGTSDGSASDNQPTQSQSIESPSDQSQQAPSEAGSDRTASQPSELGPNPCNAFSMVAGAGPAGGFASQAFGGPDVETSGSPQSDFAREVGSFAENALEQVFEGDVTADCFFQATKEDEGGVWISLTLPGSPPSGAGQSVSEAMRDKGATVAGAYSSATSQGTFDFVALEAIPVDAPGNAPAQGGLYFVSTQEGGSFAVMMVGYQPNRGNRASDPNPVPSDTDAFTQGESSAQESPEPVAAGTATPVVPSGMAGTVNGELQPALEEAFGVSLVVESFSQTAAGGTNSVTISYAVQGDLPDGTDPMASFTSVVEDFGGTVSFSMTGGGTSNVSFEGLQIGETTATGSFNMNQNQIGALLATVDS